MAELVREIPYQKQLSAQAGRTCGAAALSMVYASLGLSQDQETIWDQIVAPEGGQRRTTRSFLLARHALEYGLCAVVVQALQPWTILNSSWAGGARVILNHRLRADSPLGHFSVLAGIEEEAVLLHDPQFGPFRRLSKDQLLQLWLPTAGDSEIVGNVLIAIMSPGGETDRCQVCGGLRAKEAACARCGSPVALRPIAALGCVEHDCRARLWKYLFCPWCDFPLHEMGSNA